MYYKLLSKQDNYTCKDDEQWLTCDIYSYRMFLIDMTLETIIKLASDISK